MKGPAVPKHRRRKGMRVESIEGWEGKGGPVGWVREGVARAEKKPIVCTHE
jgi:hypothetical protein